MEIYLYLNGSQTRMSSLANLHAVRVLLGSDFWLFLPLVACMTLGIQVSQILAEQVELSNLLVTFL